MRSAVDGSPSARLVYQFQKGALPAKARHGHGPIQDRVEYLGMRILANDTFQGNPPDYEGFRWAPIDELLASPIRVSSTRA